MFEKVKKKMTDEAVEKKLEEAGNWVNAHKKDILIAGLCVNSIRMQHRINVLEAVVSNIMETQKSVITALIRR